MRKLNVLMVDDNPQFLRAARNLIAELPGVAGIACAHSGAEALAQLGRLNPDLVLTDIVMPEMSGFELIRKLRAGDAPPRVVAVTLHEGPEYRAAVLRSGAEGLVSKREFSTLAPDLIASMAGTSARTMTTSRNTISDVTIGTIVVPPGLARITCPQKLMQQASATLASRDSD